MNTLHLTTKITSTCLLSHFNQVNGVPENQRWKRSKYILKLVMGSCRICWETNISHVTRDRTSSPECYPPCRSLWLKTPRRPSFLTVCWHKVALPANARKLRARDKEKTDQLTLGSCPTMQHFSLSCSAFFSQLSASSATLHGLSPSRTFPKYNSTVSVHLFYSHRSSH